MKLERLHIEGFGCHRDRSWEFNPGLNVICGPNEAGKTTLMRCLLGLLYPLQRRRGRVTPELDRCAPWKGEKYGARLALTLDSGRSLEIIKTFSREDGKVTVVDAQKGDVTAEFLEGEAGRDREVGLKLLDLTREEFQHCAYIRYGEMSWMRQDHPPTSLAQRLEKMVDAQSGQGARAALELLRAEANRISSGRSSTRPLDKAKYDLERLRAEIAEAERRHAGIDEKDEERRALAAELARLTQEMARQDYLEILETEREITGRLERATALSAELEEIDGKAKALEIPEGVDFKTLDEELARTRAVREEHEREAAEREKDLSELSSRRERDKAELAECCQPFLATPAAELARMEDLLRRYRDNLADRDAVQESLSDEEKRLEGEGIYQGQMADFNLRFMRDPEHTELIETGKENLSELDNTIIVKNQELRELEGKRREAQGAATRLLGYGLLMVVVAAIFVAFTGPQGWAPAGVVGALGIVLALFGAVHSAGAQKRWKDPIDELEAELTSRRNERERLFRTLEEVAAALQFPSYKECRAAIERLRRNQIRMSGLQQLQMKNSQVAADLQRQEDELRKWAERLSVELPAGAFSAEHAAALGDALEDFREAGKRLAELDEEKARAREDLAARRARITEMMEQERETLARAGVTNDDLSAAYQVFDGLLQCYNESQELLRRRGEAAAALEAQCRGKRLPQLTADRNTVERQKEDALRRHPELAELPADPAPADPSERGRQRIRCAELDKQVDQLAAEVRAQRGTLPSLPEMVERAQVLEEQIARYTAYRERVLLAHEKLNEIALLSHKKWSEDLTERVGPLLSRLTRERYRDLIVDPDLRIHLRVAADKVLPPDEVENSLSSGTLDQIYLCLRVAVAGLVQPEERLPLLMDDPFLTFDPDRRRAALGWLARVAQSHQVLLFSCNPDYSELLAEAAPDASPAAIQLT